MSPFLAVPSVYTNLSCLPAISLLLALFCLYCVIFYNTAALKWGVLTYAVALVYYFLWGNKKIRPFDEEFGVLDELN